MNRLGIHHLVWHSDVGPRSLEILPFIKEAGYDGIEIPIFDPENIDIQILRSGVIDAGLSCTASTALPTGISLIDASRRKRSLAWYQSAIKAAAELGAAILCGPLALPVGEFRGRGYISEEWDSAVHAFKEIGRIAADYGVILALEPLNRFETFFLNTVGDAIRLMAAVDHASVGLLLDTFHMNIEEKSTLAAIYQAADYIKHFHCSENDRGTVGSGQVPWKEVFRALRAIHYEGWLVVESFGAAMPELARSTATWRPPASSPFSLAKDSLSFIQEQLGALD